MDSDDSAETATLIQQVARLIQQLDQGDDDASPASSGFDLAAACYDRTLELDGLDRLEAIRHAVAGARLIQALRRLGDPLPDWLDNQEEQLCRFGGMWIHELLLSSAGDPEDLGSDGVELLGRLDRIHAGRHAWIHHQMSDLERLLERPRGSTGSGIHYAIQDHGTGASLPELVDLLAGPGVSIELSLDGTDAELARLQRVPNLQGGAISLRRSHPVSWAGAGVYNETLAAMERALRLPDWTYFINASGSCLPLGGSAWIQRLLQEHSARGLLGFCDSVELQEPITWISSQREATALQRCQRVTAYDRVHWLLDPCLREMMEQERIDPARRIEMRVGLMYTETAKNTYWVRPLSSRELGERAVFLADQPLRYGRNWIVLHRSIVEWLLGSSILQQVRSFLEGCFIGDEMIFAMTLFSQENPYRSAMHTDNLRHWQGGPQRISLQELPEIMRAGNRLMVRKIAQEDYHAAAQLVRSTNGA